MSIQDEDLKNYVPPFGYASREPTKAQRDTLEKLQIDPDGVDSTGKADLIIQTLRKRIDTGMASPRQIRQLENRGFQDVGTWTFDQARRLIDRIAANGWRTPFDIDPHTYRPAAEGVRTNARL
jgi:hypothetical protein